MKVFFNNDFRLKKIEDTLDNAIIKGSEDFDKLIIYIPTELKESFNTIYPFYSVKRADGRKLGPYVTLLPQEAQTETGYFGWECYFNSRDLVVAGPLEITISFFINNRITKNAAMVTTNVRKAVVVDDDVYIINDSQIIESLLEAVKQVATYAYSFANDVVQSYSDLADVDPMGNTNFRVVVLNDSNHDDNPSMYEWNGTEWDFKGYFDWTQYLDTKFVGYKDELDDYIDDRLDEQDQTIAGLGQLKPSGVDTSTNILAKTSDTGIWIGSDTGYWYYWDASQSQYVSGGTYLSTGYNLNVALNIFYKANVVVGYYSNAGALVNNYHHIEINFGEDISGTVFRFTYEAVFINQYGLLEYNGGVKVPIKNYTTVVDDKYVEFTIPSHSTQYITKMYVNIQNVDKFMIVKNQNYPTSFIEYNKTLIMNARCENIIEFKPSISLFEKIGVVGDSYASGEIHKIVGGVDTYQDYYNLSWGQILARKNGINCINFSKGGLTTRSWLTDSMGLTLLNSSEAQNLYILALGINDLSLGLSYIGSTDDIGTTNDTFYGNYSQIIDAVITKSANAKIILSTIAKTKHPGINLATVESFNTAIINLANHYNIPYIDQYNNEFFTSNLYLDNVVSNHPVAVIYSLMAGEIQKMIEETMLTSFNYYKDYEVLS